MTIGADAPALAPIKARRAPTATVVSIGTSIANKTPATGDGISVSTLSVETSRSASSTATESPTFFNQRVTVPSLTLSPRAGIVITVPAATTATVGTTWAGTSDAASFATGSDTAGFAIGSDTTGAGVAATGWDAPSAITASSAPTATV